MSRVGGGCEGKKEYRQALRDMLTEKLMVETVLWKR